MHVPKGYSVLARIFNKGGAGVGQELYINHLAAASLYVNDYWAVFKEI